VYFKIVFKGKYLFQGFGGLTQILYNEMLSIWQMLSFTGISDEALLVGIFNTTTGFPIGTQKWFLSQKCNNVKKVLEPTMLKFSQVPPIPEISQRIAKYHLFKKNTIRVELFSRLIF
jgi:hypothetical protein